MNKTYYQVVEIYNSGVTLQREIAMKLGISQQHVSYYLGIAKKEGVLRESKFDQTVKLYNSGIKKRQQIVKALNISPSTASKYLREARQNGLLKENIQYVIKEQKPNNSNPRTKQEIKKVLKQEFYPQDVARRLSITSKIVYDILDQMTDKEIKERQRALLKNNYIFKKVAKSRKKEEKPVAQVLEEIKSELGGSGLLELSDFCYVMGMKVESQAALNRIIYGESFDERVKKKALEKKEKLLIEYKAQEIREYYKKIKETSGSSAIPFEHLCRKYNVRTSFIIQILGRESIERT